ncbi:AsmA-like C-terminal region-containing protein, partial [Escherichia coli]|nr:AsmA-like C-terminal region-containing protein [Escherichia coli]
DKVAREADKRVQEVTASLSGVYELILVAATDGTLVDGLEADIAMKGSVNLVRRDLNMEAVVAPEISATVGVAAAFAVNPIVGAAVFAASKVLGPLWSKVSILRYHISGPLDDPQINEVLRQPRKEKAQ